MIFCFFLFSHDWKKSLLVGLSAPESKFDYYGIRRGGECIRVSSSDSRLSITLPRETCSETSLYGTETQKPTVHLCDLCALRGSSPPLGHRLKLGADAPFPHQRYPPFFLFRGIASRADLKPGSAGGKRFCVQSLNKIPFRRIFDKFFFDRQPINFEPVWCSKLWSMSKIPADRIDCRSPSEHFSIAVSKLQCFFSAVLGYRAFCVSLQPVPPRINQNLESRVRVPALPGLSTVPYGTEYD